MSFFSSILPGMDSAVWRCLVSALVEEGYNGTLSAFVEVPTVGAYPCKTGIDDHDRAPALFLSS